MKLVLNLFLFDQAGFSWYWYWRSTRSNVQIFCSPSPRVCLQLYEKIENCLTGVPCTVALNFWDGPGGRRCPGGRCSGMCPSGIRDPKRRACPAKVDPREGRVHGADENQLRETLLGWCCMQPPHVESQCVQACRRCEELANVLI